MILEYIEAALNKGIQTVYRLETTSGKWIETTSEHPYLVLEEELANKLIGNDHQNNKNQNQTKSYKKSNKNKPLVQN